MLSQLLLVQTPPGKQTPIVLDSVPVTILGSAYVNFHGRYELRCPENYFYHLRHLNVVDLIYVNFFV